VIIKPTPASLKGQEPAPQIDLLGQRAMAGGEVRVPEGDPLAVVDPTTPTGSSKSWPICASITATRRFT
jgi:hypothetical protein